MKAEAKPFHQCGKSRCTEPISSSAPPSSFLSPALLGASHSHSLTVFKDSCPAQPLTHDETAPPARALPSQPFLATDAARKTCRHRHSRCTARRTGWREDQNRCGTWAQVNILKADDGRVSRAPGIRARVQAGFWLPEPVVQSGLAVLPRI